MIIESIIRRKNGTVVELDELRYHFKPVGADPRHLAEVTRKEHIARFLSITEGYQVPDDHAPADPIEPPAPITGTLAGVQEQDGTVRTLDQLEEVELRAIAIEMEIDGARELPVSDLITAIQAEEVEIDGIDTRAPVKTEQQGEQQPVKTDEQKPEQPAQAEEQKQTQQEEQKPEQKAEPAPAADGDREALAKQYKAKFGKLPHHKLSAERIKQILEEEAE